MILQRLLWSIYHNTELSCRGCWLAIAAKKTGNRGYSSTLSSSATVSSHPSHFTSPHRYLENYEQELRTSELQFWTELSTLCQTWLNRFGLWKYGEQGCYSPRSSLDVEICMSPPFTNPFKAKSMLLCSPFRSSNDARTVRSADSG